MHKSLAIITVLLASVLLPSSCTFTSFDSRSIPPIPISKPSVPENTYAPFEMPKIDLKASDAELREFSEEIRRLIDARDFDGLEKKAESYAATKERFIGGGWKVHSIDISILGGGRRSITQRIEYLDEWLRARPDSVLARSLLVSAHISHAWDARGSDYANSVSKEQWRVYYERIDEAAREFRSAEQQSGRCHKFYEAAIELARAQSWKKEDSDKYFDEAIKFDPAYQYFYTAKAIELMPRWGGRPGEWEKFASDVRESIGGAAGLQMYYLIVAEVAELKSDDFFRENQVSWAATKEGFRLFATEYGMTNSKMSFFAILAKRAKDTKVTCSAFKELSADNIETAYWDDRASFERSKQMAEMMCKFPKADNQAK